MGVYGESGSCSSTLVTQTLTITDPSTLTINTNLIGDAVCANETFTITVSDTQSSNTTYTFSYGGAGSPQTKNSSTGQVTFTLSGGLAAAGDNYISVVSTPSGGCPSTVTKTVYVPELALAGTMVSSQGVLCYGEAISANISSTAEATLTGGSSAASITYKWYYSQDGASSWLEAVSYTHLTLPTSDLV